MCVCLNMCEAVYKCLCKFKLQTSQIDKKTLIYLFLMTKIRYVSRRGWKHLKERELLTEKLKERKQKQTNWN